jgi:serine/threonine protein kinase
MNSVAETTRLTELQVLCIFEQILHGVVYLHTREPPIIHRDMKIENIFHSYNSQYKIGDFGSATTKEEDPASLNLSQRRALQELLQKKTTPCYSAPEMADLFRKKKIGTKSDVWALGWLLSFSRGVDSAGEREWRSLHSKEEEKEEEEKEEQAEETEEEEEEEKNRTSQSSALLILSIV